VLSETLSQTLTCPHWGTCGGCAVENGLSESLAPVPYEEELLRKQARVQSLLAPFDVEAWKPILPSPQVWFYRNKMEFALGQEGEARLALGLRRAGRFDRIVDLERCLLMSPEASEILRRVRAWAAAAGLTGYHRRAHQGDLRYLVLREGKNTGERLMILIANKNSAALDDPQPLQTLREETEPLVTTAWLGLAQTQSDVARGETMRLLWGPGTLSEKLGDLDFRVSPYSFFQTNTRGAEKLYALLQQWAGPSDVKTPGALLDLYCGSGAIALSLAGRFDRVVGVDSNREAIEDAAYNAERNAVANVEFVAGDAVEFLQKLPASKLSVQLSAIVVDPPRPGLMPKALQALVELNPPRLAYVSCNPESLARDLQSLAALYAIQSVQPVDLFPHTAHVETLALLRHR